jgi:hypothetical protein
MNMPAAIGRVLSAWAAIYHITDAGRALLEQR